MNDNIQNIKSYLSTSLGYEATIVPLASRHKKLLPILITESYGLYVCMLMDVEACLMICRDNGATPVRLKKHCDMVQRLLCMHSVVVISEVKAYNLQRMIAERLNFIVPGRQLFIPSLLMDLRQPRNPVNTEGLPMPVAAQCIVLYHLKKQSLNGLSAQPIADLFEMSYPNISRAIKWLNENHMATLSDGREKQLTFVAEREELWALALPFMQSPIERVLHTDANLDALIAGEKALAEISMLAEPTNQCWAISKVQARELSGKLSKEYGDNSVEVWRYNPQLLSEGNDCVDTLSLYLSLRNSDDERVHKELNKVMNEMKW